MNTEAITSNTVTAVNGRKSHSPYKYKKVLDGRKQPIRGLWERNGKFIARLSVEDDNGTKRSQWVALDGAVTIPQAQERLKTLHVDRTRNELPTLKRTPKFADFADKYFTLLESEPDRKRASTVEKEKSAIELWTAHMGGVRLDKIRKLHINSFIQKRQADGMKGRTVNLDIIALRNILKRAIDDGWIKNLPTENLRPLQQTPPKRELVTQAEIDKLCAAGLTVSKNGQEFSDYILLMAYSGARRNEALRLKWSDVDFQQGQLTIGSDGLNKGHEVRRVDLNTNLQKHLQSMSTRRAPDSEWLFPSPQRGKKDIAAKTFKQSLSAARAKAEMPKFGFHDCRHFFVSYCVMSGIDFMTIAKWAGHKDGGVLIGKVYGHLADAHTKQQAQRVNFGPQVVEALA
jgi:integrase